MLQVLFDDGKAAIVPRDGSGLGQLADVLFGLGVEKKKKKRPSGNLSAHRI